MAIDSIEQKRAVAKAYKKAWYLANKARLKVKNAEYRQANKAKYKAYLAAYRAANREKLTAAQKRWREANKERHAASMAAWREANRDRIKAQVSAYYAANREQIKAYVRKWTQENRDHVIQRHTAYIAANGDKVRTWRRNYRSRKANAEGRCTPKQIAALYVHQNGLCAYCQISIEDRWEADHVIPLSKGGSNKIDNVVLACPGCNRRKSAALPEEWEARMRQSRGRQLNR